MSYLMSSGMDETYNMLFIPYTLAVMLQAMTAFVAPRKRRLQLLSLVSQDHRPANS